MKPRILIRQHRSLEHQLRKLSSGEEDHSLRLRLVEDLSVHLSAELDVLYPALRRAGSIATPSEMDLLLRAREVLSVVAPQPMGYHRSLQELTTVFARHVDTQERTLFPSCEERLDAGTFQRILEDVSIASFHLAASARLLALRA